MPACISSLLAVILLICAYSIYFKKSGRSLEPFSGCRVRIEPISSDFEWQHTAPRKFRSFRPKYNLTMGITKPSHQDWLLLENTYLDRVNHHKAVFNSKKHRDETGLCNAVAEGAVAELYDLVVSFLLRRFPMYFQLGHTRNTEAVLNKILGTSLPANSQLALAKGNSHRDLLRIIGEHTEEDFLLMGYDPSVKEYRLQACTGIAATGFLWKERMGFKLTDLHGPIPNYKEKLQFSMNKYFSKMVPGDIVQRTTYKIQNSAPGEIFYPDRNARKSSLMDFENCIHMRLERQQLFRLPKSNFILFTIRTYMYPLAEIKKEGMALDMAASIRSWPDDFASYKHREEWGEQVLQYLEASA